MFIDFPFNEDKRKHLHGWCKGGYTCLCRCCAKGFIGAKGAYNCADCAYNFDEQLEYERLWREVGWQYTLQWIYKNSSLYKGDG